MAGVTFFGNSLTDAYSLPFFDLFALRLYHACYKGDDITSQESLDGSSETADELDQHQLSSANLRANVSALFGERPQIASGRVDILARCKMQATASPRVSTAH